MDESYIVPPAGARIPSLEPAVGAEALPVRVLIVEDDPVYARLVQRWLAQPAFEGAPEFQATLVGSLQEALAALAQDSFDAVVLDLGLPDSEGAHTLTELRRAISSPVVVLTAIGDEAFAASLVSLGAQDYISKGQGDPDRLQRSLSYALKRHRLEVALRRQNQALRALSDCNRVVGRARRREELLRQVCEVIVERTGYRFAWIGVPQGGPGAPVKPVAWAGHALSYLQEITVSTDDAILSQGPAGRALRERRPQVVEDVVTDPAFRPWVRPALAHGYRSVVALPLKTKGGFQGVLAVYASEPGAFDREATGLLQELATNLNVGLERIEAQEREVRAQKERRAAEARYRLLAEVAPVGIMQVTRRGECTYVNDHLCAMMKLPRERLLGYGWQEFLPGGELGRLVEEWHRCGRERPFQTELRVVRSDGAPIWLSLQLAPVADSGGKDQGYVGAVVDITRRHEAEAALEELNRGLEQMVRDRTRDLEEAVRELESFTHSLAHDIRAPVRRVVAFCELLFLRCGETLPEQARHYARSARENAAHLDRLLQDLLGLARVRSRPLRRRTVDFTALCARVLASLHENEPERRVIWDVKEGLSLKADPNLIEVATVNLLENAWKYTRGQSEARIWVGSWVEEGERWFYVRDNGVGFDPAFAHKLFHPFSRLHRPEEFEGTGIGLATVYRVISRHGGKVKAEGRPGEGATFAFTLPAPAGD